VKVSIIRRSSNCNKRLVKTCTNKHKLKLLSYIHKILNRQPIVTRHSLIYMVVIILFCVPYVYISCFLCTKNGRMKRVMAGRNRWWQQRYRLFFLSLLILVETPISSCMYVWMCCIESYCSNSCYAINSR